MEMSMQIMKQFLLNEEDELKKNFVFSPLSINTLSSILANGLKPGCTLDSLLSLLGFKTLADLNANACTDHQLTSLNANDGPQLFSVNGFWIDKKYRLDPSLEKALAMLYFVTREEAVDKINTWAADSTKGLIRNLFEYEAVSKETRLILANALYFKGAWDSPFDPSRIRTENFYILNDDVVQVPYMCNNDLDSGLYVSSEGFKVLRIPYENYWYRKKRGEKVFAMYILLPDDKDGLLNLLDQISSDPCLLDLQFELSTTYRIRKLRIPKFKFKFNFQLSKVTKRLGLSMKEEKLVNICHSSCIDINEHGTEAAAVTEDTLGSPIFLGAVVNPLLE
ncbi:Serpin family [Parasponia andersonii]|uniref:Serpin family n=1 Tax=Parasponia andersonii TaxID=3476 RepID=A0A2P5CRI4_PARAD|nr:Serpin family [Parasponia andersonii]